MLVNYASNISLSIVSINQMNVIFYVLSIYRLTNKILELVVRENISNLIINSFRTEFI